MPEAQPIATFSSPGPTGATRVAYVQSAFFSFEVVNAAQSDVRCTEVNLCVTFDTEFVAWVVWNSNATNQRRAVVLARQVVYAETERASVVQVANLVEVYSISKIVEFAVDASVIPPCESLTSLQAAYSDVGLL